MVENEQQDYLALIDRHIADLQERITTLKARMTVMEDEQLSIAPQAELLSTMMEVLESIHTIRTNLAQSTITAVTPL